MKRDPVLAQLDFLINGPAPKASRADEEPEPEPPPPPPPLLPPLDAQLPAPDPVLAQLDALINGAPPAPQATAAALVPEAPEEPRGPPGILREYGGVRGWMAMRGYQEDHSTSPKRSTPTGAVAV